MALTMTIDVSPSLWRDEGQFVWPDSDYLTVLVVQVFDRLRELAVKERSDMVDSRGSKGLRSRERRERMKVDVVDRSTDEKDDVL